MEVGHRGEGADNHNRTRIMEVLMEVEELDHALDVERWDTSKQTAGPKEKEQEREKASMVLRIGMPGLWTLGAPGTPIRT